MADRIDGVPLPSALLVELYEAERQFIVASEVERQARETLEPYIRRTEEARSRKQRALRAVQEAIRADEVRSS